MLKIVVIGDQLTSLKACPFIILIAPKFNKLASPFGKAQLDDTKLHSAAVAPGFCSSRNIPPRFRILPMFLGTLPKK